MLDQQSAHVYEVLRREKLLITARGLEALQERLMRQYNHRGKLGAYQRAVADYEAVVEEGRRLGPQTGLPFAQESLGSQ